MGISVIYFNNFQYSKAVEQRRVDPVVRTGPKSVLTLSRMVHCQKSAHQSLLHRLTDPTDTPDPRHAKPNRHIMVEKKNNNW